MLNFIAPVNTVSYGYTACYLLEALQRQGVDVALHPIGAAQPEKKFEQSVVTALQRAKTPPVNSPGIRLWHQFDMSLFCGSPRIGFPIFELDKFNDIEKHHLNSLDHIFVPSDWAKEVVLQETQKKKEEVSVVPLGVDVNMFTPSPSKEKKTIFFNAGKWEIRKGHDILVKAFNEAFTADDDVELWMMCHNLFYSDEENREWEKYYLNSKLGSKIKIIPRVGSHEEVSFVIQNIDCGVFISRGEGWNLELLECLACGKHVITTDYSAHTQFCTDSNAKLIPVNETELAQDGRWFKGQGNWAKITKESIDLAVEYMREIHREKQQTGRILNEEGYKTGQKFTWENSAKSIMSHLDKLSPSWKTT